MKPLQVIAGPTASGKTAFAIQVALRIGAEIVSADSQQVYRHFDLGTAKPSPAQLAQVPHHLLSFVEPRPAPAAGFSAGQYVEAADAAIAAIRARGKEVVVVGGTGLYIRALLHGVMPLPEADLALRKRLEGEAAAEGSVALHRRLSQVDAASAARIAPEDRLRIVRALEIFHQTGTPASALRDAHRFAEDRYPHTLRILSPPREALHQAIDARTRSLFAQGLVEETRRLVEHGFRDTPPMGSVGYRQALEVVEGRWSVERALEEVARETRRYAKRQITWFRKEPGGRWVAPPYPVE